VNFICVNQMQKFFYRMNILPLAEIVLFTNKLINVVMLELPCPIYCVLKFR